MVNNMMISTKIVLIMAIVIFILGLYLIHRTHTKAWFNLAIFFILMNIEGNDSVDLAKLIIDGKHEQGATLYIDILNKLYKDKEIK